ncbi:MAG: hypothetical protein R3179_02250, partial [Sedimenticolaceae bacterium]|nr:hypothetical protein [Sedimenticolaceae bacterium]
MSKEPTLDDLEQALMDRARRLADEYLARAESTRERMLRDENEHLRIREEREVLAAELEAERLYRSKVQATEMELRSELDRRRWEMVQQLKRSISKRLNEIATSDDYAAILQRFLGAAVEAIRDEEGLVAQLCERDHAREHGGSIRGRQIRHLRCPSVPRRAARGQHLADLSAAEHRRALIQYT